MGVCNSLGGRGLQKRKNVSGRSARRVTIGKCARAQRDLVRQGQTIKRVSYYKVLKHLKVDIRWNRPDLRSTKKWFLFVGLSSFVSFSPKPAWYHFLPHALDSPDVAPAGSYLSPKMKIHLKRSPFQHRCRDPVRIAKGLWLTYTKQLPGTPKPVYSFARRLFRRRRWS